MRRAALLILCAIPLSGVLAEEQSYLWNDGEPEVVLGAYFDEAGTDTILEGAVPDTLAVYLTMWNGSLREEGPVMAVEYQIELPEGLTLLMDKMPEYSNLSIGTVEKGIAQAIIQKEGHGLLLNKLLLIRSGDVAPDARIRILPHPKSKFLHYVHRWGPTLDDAHTHLMLPQDAILNPKLSGSPFKPVRSR